jgi:AcrR family transcriptional regulator
MKDVEITINPDQRQRYVTLALELFGSRFYDDVTPDDLATALRISPSKFESLFPSKYELYVEGIEMVKQEILSAMTFDPENTFEQGLKIVVRNFVAYVSQKPELFQALLSSANQGHARKEIRNIVQETREEMVHRIARKMGVPGDIPMVRLLIRGSIGFVEATTLAWMEKGDLHIEQVIELINGALQTSLIPLAALFPKQ